MTEVWKEIPGTLYSVSNEGRVASRKGGRWKKGGWRVLRPGLMSVGYLSVNLCVGEKPRTFTIHRLVAEAFLGSPPSPLHQINHIDGVKVNNRIENLEWCTPRENSQHTYDVLGRKALRGEASGRAKVTEVEVREMRVRHAAGEIFRVLASDYGLSQASVRLIIRGRNWAWLDSGVSP